MKNNFPFNLVIFVLLATTLTGCDLISGIFEAGVWVGVILVVLVIALVFWIIKKMLS